MKRGLFYNIKAMPYTSGDAVDRQGFLSAVIAVAASTAGTLAVAVTHADTVEGTFEPVPDERVILSGTGAMAENDLDQVEIDLAGCKRFVKLTISGVTGSCALVLGDPARAPVEG